MQFSSNDKNNNNELDLKVSFSALKDIVQENKIDKVQEIYAIKNRGEKTA